MWKDFPPLSSQFSMSCVCLASGWFWNPSPPSQIDALRPFAQVLWVYFSHLTGRQSDLSSSAGPGGVLCTFREGGGIRARRCGSLLLQGQCEWHALRREGTHLAGSVCAIIVSYPSFQAAFSSSGLFIIISVWLIGVFVCVRVWRGGVILDMCVGRRVVGLHMSREEKIGVFFLVCLCVCVCVRACTPHM